MHPAPRGALLAAGAVAGFAAGYLTLVRPRLLRWGATVDEVRGPYPGAGLIPGSTRGATMAVTIDAPPSHVWPWLVQMGTDRAGWYSWDRLDNFGRRSKRASIPSGRRSPLVTEWWRRPTAASGGRSRRLNPSGFWACVCRSISGGVPSTRHEPGHAITPTRSGDSSCGESAGERTRLVVSGYWSLQPQWLQPILSITMLEPAHWVMQTRQFSNLVRLASR